MKPINKILVPLIALGLGSCATLPRTYAPEEYVGMFQSKQPMKRNTLVTTDRGSHLPVIGDPEINTEEHCYVTFDIVNSVITGRPRFETNLRTKDSEGKYKGKYKIPRRKRAF